MYYLNCMNYLKYLNNEMFLRLYNLPQSSITKDFIEQVWFMKQFQTSLYYFL